MTATDKDEAPATRSPIDGWTLLAGAAALSAGLLSIGFKTDSDRLYDLYFYGLALVVAAFAARDLGILKVDPLRLLGLGGPPSAPADP